MSDQPFPDQMTDEPYFADLSAEERQWGMLAHLSSLGGLIAGGLFFLGPLVVWLIKKDQMRFVDDQGKESLNFQLNVFLLGLALGFLAIPLAILTFGFGMFLLFPLGLAWAALAIIMPIVAAVKANAGEAYRYPYVLRLIK
jgi:uncharacterized Tic20 family protein